MCYPLPWQIQKKNYNDLRGAITKVLKNDCVIADDDRNKRVECKSGVWFEAISIHRTGKYNSNEELLLLLCVNFNIVITNSAFWYKGPYKTLERIQSLSISTYWIIYLQGENLVKGHYRIIPIMLLYYWFAVNRLILHYLHILYALYHELCICYSFVISGPAIIYLLFCTIICIYCLEPTWCQVTVLY